MVRRTYVSRAQRVLLDALPQWQAGGGELEETPAEWGAGAAGAGDKAVRGVARRVRIAARKLLNATLPAPATAA